MDLTALPVANVGRSELSAEELLEACVLIGLVAWCSPAQWGALPPALRAWSQFRKADCQHTTFRPEEPQLPCPHPECWKHGPVLRVLHPMPFRHFLEPNIGEALPVDHYELNQLGLGRMRFYAWRKND
jgi:hypothetical protein